MKSAPVQTRPTPLGSTVLWISVFVTAAGAIRLSAPLLLIGLLFLGLWLACRILAQKHLCGLRARRSLPSRAWVGQSFAIESTILNGSPNRSARAFQFTDPLAVSRKQKVFSLTGNAEVSASYAAKIHRRGHQSPHHWSAVSTWPLGWFESRFSGTFLPHRKDAAGILVLPNPFLPALLQERIEGSITISTLSQGLADPAAEFRMLREFRSGDPVRGIHWPTSLRTGQLLVREPDPPHPVPSQYGILIHSYQPHREIVTPETFEMILRIAAGLLYRFREAGIEILFQHLPTKPVRLRNREDFDRELDRLALIFRSPLDSLDPLEKCAPLFESCDEVFVLGDTTRDLWQADILKAFGPCSCIDASSLSLASRPTVKRKSLLAS